MTPLMQRASSLLLSTRSEKDLSLAEISQKLKIPEKYLTAFESENSSNFPAEPYCSLMVKDYANFLGLNGEETLSLFRRDFETKNKLKNQNQPQRFFVTPQVVFTLSVVILVLGFLGYLIIEYIKFNHPPLLRVNWPAAVSPNSAIEISGITDSESTVRINQDLVLVDPKGNFSKKINYSGGELKIIIESRSQSGKVTTTEKLYK